MAKHTPQLQVLLSLMVDCGVWLKDHNIDSNLIETITQYVPKWTLKVIYSFSNFQSLYINSSYISISKSILPLLAKHSYSVSQFQRLQSVMYVEVALDSSNGSG